MTKRTHNDPRGRSPRPPARRPAPPRRLPQRVYWVRRLLVLGVAAVLVLGITRLLSMGGGGGGDTAAQASGGTSTSPTAIGSPTDGTSPTAYRTGRKGLVRPNGACDPSDVLVTPVVTQAHVAQPVRIVLEVTSIQSQACTFEVSPDSVIVRLLSPKRSEPLWTTQDCTTAVPERSVVARQTRPGRVEVFWDGRTSDDQCSNLTDWVFPGDYTAQAIAVGSSRATSSEFVLGMAIRPTVTKTPTPTPSPSRGASGKPSSDSSGKPSGKPGASPSSR